ncbi:MAG: isoleucine--tRNA ligase [Candidatus Micrarchaeia archaeon]
MDGNLEAAHHSDECHEEEKIISYWKEHEILQKVRQKNIAGKIFFFLDGPPYASGDLHIGQLWVKSVKDSILRYKRFRGFNVYDRAGYDVHGLPIENKVEKKLGLKYKKEIEERIGIENFIEECKNFADTYIGRMSAGFERFGISLDFSNPYIPYTNDYIEGAWKILKIADKKGLLYKENKPMLYCPHCETAVAQGGAEIVYSNDSDPSILVAFKISKAGNSKIKTTDNLYMLAWTTTPWTLPANMMLAVNPEDIYVVTEIKGMNLVFAKNRMDYVAKALNESIIVKEEFYGTELEGMEYINPLEDKVPIQKDFMKYHKVILSKSLVSNDEGTGVVHIAPGHGPEDYLAGKEHKVPIFSPVDTHGFYTNEAGIYKGLKIPDEANKKICEDLKSVGALLKEEQVNHSYPHCWRCNTKLIFIATPQWFIDIQKIKKGIIEENEKVVWHPAEAKDWFKSALESAPDWVISRQRYWGIPIPIWQCNKCGNMKVIGSLKELEEAGADLSRLTDLHRPYIDKIKIKCDKCGGEMERIPDLFDVWFDSGVAHTASIDKNRMNLENGFVPADYIIEGRDQIRGWFATLMKTSFIAYEKAPYLHVALDGMMLGSDGREMHKSLGNGATAEEILEFASADAFRLWCLEHTPWIDMLYNKNDVIENGKNLIMLKNIMKLIEEYKNALGYNILPYQKIDYSTLSKDQAWIISRLNTTIKEVNEAFDNYEVFNAVISIKKFMILDFSRFYIKEAKKRISKGGEEAKKELSLLSHVMHTLIILLAPITPFISEDIYTKMYKNEKESVFLNDWPEYSERLIKKELEKEFAIAKEVISAVLNSREKAGIKLSWPIKAAYIEAKNDEILKQIEKVEDIIKDYINAKSLSIKLANDIKEQIVPNFKALGPDFKLDAPIVAGLLKSQNAEEIKKEINKNGYFDILYDGRIFKIKPGHFSLKTVTEEKNEIVSDFGKVYIDTKIDESIKEEAFVRGFERAIQLMRKKEGLKKSDKIAVSYRCVGYLDSVIKKNMEKIKKHVGIVYTEEDKGKEFNADIEGEKAYISIKKV